MHLICCCTARVHHAIEHEVQGSSAFACRYLERILPHPSGDSGPSPHLSMTLTSSRPDSWAVPAAAKTRHAVEKAKGLTMDGQRVGRFRYNEGLAEHLRPAYWGELQPPLRAKQTGRHRRRR